MLTNVLLTVAVLLAAAWVAATAWWRPRDEQIDGLIAEKGARYRPGMEVPDQATLARLGARRWETVERAQRRSRGADVARQTNRLIDGGGRWTA